MSPCPRDNPPRCSARDDGDARLKGLKSAWDTLKTVRLGVARVRDARAETLNKQFATI
jgi:hypothetical protein